jgi:hypothetical protein
MSKNIGTEQEWRGLERRWAHGLRHLTIRDKAMLAERRARAKHRDDISAGRVVRYEDGRCVRDVVHGNPLSAEISVRGCMSTEEVERRFHSNGWPKEHPDSSATRGRILGPRAQNEAAALPAL